MSRLLQAERPVVLDWVTLLSAFVAASIVIAPTEAQTTTQDEAYIRQVATPVQEDSDPSPTTSLDLRAAELWPELRCAGLGNSDAECVLSSSGTVPSSADGNSAHIVQSGSHNVATIVQEGNANVLHASQIGDGNTLNAEQFGDRNRIAARLVGNENSLQVEQYGDDNAYLFSFEGDGIDHSLIQYGSDLRAVQLGTGDLDLPYSIEQRGTDMQIRIGHDPIGGWPQ